MLDYQGFIENSKAFSIIKKDLECDKVSHAYLFVCKDKNLLYKFVLETSKVLINENETEAKDKNILRIDKCMHPDVKMFGLDKNIDTETANAIVDASSYSPFESDKKIFILLGANEMNESAQNKILKTIEEPPKNTYFILCANGTSKILQTILSRVKQIDIDEMPSDVITGLLVQNGIHESKASVLAGCANGNAEFAEKLALDDDFIDFYNDIVNALYEINGSRDVLKYSNKFTQKNIDKNEFFNISLVLCRDALMILSGKTDFVVNKNAITKLKLVASMLNAESLIELIRKCEEEKNKLQANVNSTAVIDDFLFKLAEVKVRCRRL